MLIGTGKRRDELYYFKRILRAQAIKSLNLWHRRLGHLFMRITQLVLKIKNHNDNSNKNYDVCQRTKQKRDNFFVSDHKTVTIFKLIHCDLWIKYRIVLSYGALYFFDNNR